MTDARHARSSATPKHPTAPGTNGSRHGSTWTHSRPVTSVVILRPRRLADALAVVWAVVGVAAE